MKRFFSALLPLFCLTSLAAAEDEFFEPGFGGKEPGHLVPPGDRSMSRTKDRLWTTHHPIVRYQVFPSFTPSYCVSVGEADDRGGYFITATSTVKAGVGVEESEAAMATADTAPVIEVKRQISAPLAIAIQRVWARVILKTRYPAHPSDGLDGATYDFSVFVRGYGFVEGQTWSPRTGVPAKMVELGEVLRVLANDEQEKEEPLIERLKKFEEQVAKE
jgi:hypothetical protein